MATRASELEDVLAQRLKEAGADVALPLDDDLGIQLGAGQFVVHLKAARDARARILQSFLAEGVLEAQARARNQVPLLPMVGAPAVSDGMVNRLQAFVHRVAPKQRWGVVDGRGRLEIFAGDDSIHFPPRDEPTPQLRSQRSSLFTDVHQWLLKVLLAPELPRDLLAAQRESITSTRSLAKAAEVSVGSAGRFLSALTAEGFLARSGRQIQIARRQELLEVWRAASRPKSTPLGVSWVIAPSNTDEAIRRLQLALGKESVGCCVGSHRACKALGFGFVRGVKPLLYVESLGDAAKVLKACGAMPASGEKAPDFFLDVPSAPRSCFSGAVTRNELRVSDVLQAWLDVSWHPARGREQAQRLWERVLAPRLLSPEEES